MYNLQTIKKQKGALAPSFGPLVWLDGADSSSMTISTTISQWRDKSGNGFNANQSTGGLQPTLLAGAQNGRSAVSFGGSQGMNLTSVPLSAFVMFVVFRASAGLLIYEHSADANNNPGSYLNATTGQTIIVHRTGGATNVSAKDSGTNWGLGSTWRIAAQWFDGTNAGHQLFVNNANQALTTNFSVNPGLTLITDSLYIASRNNASAFLTGDIAEIVLYNSALPSDKMNVVFGYLNNKWRVY